MKRVAKTRIGTYYTVFDLLLHRASFTVKILILYLPVIDFGKSGCEHKILIFTVKGFLKSKTVYYVPILVFATLFISGVKIPKFVSYVTTHYVIGAYVIGIKNRRNT